MSRAKWAKRPDGLTDSALKHWRRLAPKLITSEQLHADNVESFKILCRTLALLEAASVEIERDGVTIVTKTGTRKPHPACAVLLRAQQQAAEMLSGFGLA